MNLDSALEIGIIPSAIIDSILGRMTSTAASLIASCAVLIKSKPATIPITVPISAPITDISPKIPNFSLICSEDALISRSPGILLITHIHPCAQDAVKVPEVATTEIPSKPLNSCIFLA